MKKFVKTLAIILCFIITTSPFAPTTTKAKTTPKLNFTKKTIITGSSFKLKLKGAKGKIKWSSTKKKVAEVTNKGKVIAKGKGTTKIIAKHKNKKYTCTVVVKVQYGSLKGNISYHYNEYKGYVPDTGALIFLLSADGSKLVAKGEADGNGDYIINHIPTGSYSVVISSSGCNDIDVLNGKESDDFYKKYDEFLNVGGAIHYDYVTIYKNETSTLSHNFPYSDY